MEKLFELLKFGGKIVSSNSVNQVVWIQAQACNRTWVDNDGFGFIYLPDYKHEV